MTTHISPIEKANLLDWLSENRSLELSYQGWDEDSCWQVHRVTGGRNDREWTLLAEGATAAEALQKAKCRSSRMTSPENNSLKSEG